MSTEAGNSNGSQDLAFEGPAYRPATEKPWYQGFCSGAFCPGARLPAGRRGSLRGFYLPLASFEPPLGRPREEFSQQLMTQEG